MEKKSTDLAHLPVPLSVKTIYGGGRGDKPWTPALQTLQDAVRAVRGTDVVPFGLTATFLVPGETYSARSFGIRVSTFLDEHRTLVVQVSLPPQPKENAWLEILGNLDKAIERAESWGHRKKMLQGQLIEARAVATSLRGIRP